MNEDIWNTRYFKSIGGLLILLAVASILFPNIPPPADWLIGWTDWFLKFAGVGTVAGGFWVVSTAAAVRLRQK